MLWIITGDMKERRSRSALSSHAAALSNYSDIGAPALPGDMQKAHELFADYLLRVIKSLRRRGV